LASKHKYISHTADIAFEIEADSLEELFVEAFRVWFISIVELSEFQPDRSIDIEIKADSLEQLLVDFLNEVNFLLLVRKILCVSVEEIRVDEKLFSLFAKVNYQPLSEKIELKEEIKSVTYHQMEIVNSNGNYNAIVVFDI
jgi:SHS2 domain-containing protein